MEKIKCDIVEDIEQAGLRGVGFITGHSVHRFGIQIARMLVVMRT